MGRLMMKNKQEGLRKLWIEDQQESHGDLTSTRILGHNRQHCVVLVYERPGLCHQME